MTSTGQAARWGLARYVIAATLARTADGGGVVAVVLLVTTSGGPGWTAGLLGACLTLPHLAGPFIARSLDVARDGRTVLAAACVLHGGLLAAAVLSYPHAWVGVPAVLLIASGVFGPLLTGGISSRLPAIAGPDLIAQRRAQGWDVATYGIGGTIGPTAVAVVAAWTNATAAALVLAGGTLLAAFVVRLLPYAAPHGTDADVPHPVRTLQIIARTGALRRTLYLTMIVALSVGVLPVTAVASAGLFSVEPAVAGALAACYGLGGLAGSVVVMVRPLRRDPDAAMPLLAALVAGALAGVFLAPGFWIAAAGYVTAGVLNSLFFAATLAARSEYSPLPVRSQVFVWVGALKIAAGAAGTAAAGALVTHGVQLPVALAGTVTAVGVGIALLDRRIGPPAAPTGDQKTL